MKKHCFFKNLRHVYCSSRKIQKTPIIVYILRFKNQFSLLWRTTGHLCNTIQNWDKSSHSFLSRSNNAGNSIKVWTITVIRIILISIALYMIVCKKQEITLILIINFYTIVEYDHWQVMTRFLSHTTKKKKHHPTM